MVTSELQKNAAALGISLGRSGILKPFERENVEMRISVHVFMTVNMCG